MSEKTSKEKGDILEEIVEKLCSDFGASKVTRNAFIDGKSGTKRQIDVLIESTQKSFDVRIIVEAKNYSSKVGIDKVEALKTKLTDVDGNLGVMVCPLGFTDGAINAASLHNIQLFQVFDHKLGNTNSFIPFRYIVPYVKNYAAKFISRALNNQFSIPLDLNEVRFCIGNKIYDLKNLVAYAWNENMFSREVGEQIADFGVLKIFDKKDVNRTYYVEFKLRLKVVADYYVKLFPSSFMKNIKSGKGNHQIHIDAYSKKEDMIRNGWKHFETKTDMDNFANQYDVSKDVSKLLAVEDYTLGYTSI